MLKLAHAQILSRAAAVSEKWANHFGVPFRAARMTATKRSFRPSLDGVFGWLCTASLCMNVQRLTDRRIALMGGAIRLAQLVQFGPSLPDKP